MARQEALARRFPSLINLAAAPLAPHVMSVDEMEADLQKRRSASGPGGATKSVKAPPLPHTPPRPQEPAAALASAAPAAALAAADASGGDQVEILRPFGAPLHKQRHSWLKAAVCPV